MVWQLHTVSHRKQTILGLNGRNLKPALFRLLLCYFHFVVYLQLCGYQLRRGLYDGRGRATAYVRPHCDQELDEGYDLGSR